MIKKSIDTWAAFITDNSNVKKNGGLDTYSKAICRHCNYTITAQASRLTAHLEDCALYKLLHTLADSEQAKTTFKASSLSKLLSPVLN